VIAREVVIWRVEYDSARQRAENTSGWTMRCSVIAGEDHLTGEITITLTAEEATVAMKAVASQNDPKAIRYRLTLEPLSEAQ
jgi:hypothetical protein